MSDDSSSSNDDSSVKSSTTASADDRSDISDEALDRNSAESESSDDENSMFDDLDIDSPCFITPQSRLFSPYGTLTVPSGRFVLNQADTQNFLTLYNRKIWQICSAEKLHRSIQGSIPHRIRAANEDEGVVEESDIVGVLNDISGQRTLVCTENRVYVFHRGRLLSIRSLSELLINQQVDNSEQSYMIRGLISLSRDQGTWSVALLVRSNDKNEDDAIDDSSATSTVKIQMLHISRTIIMKVDDFKVVMLPKGQIVDGSFMVHPPTYINKVIVSGCDANGNGVLLLVNIRTGTIIYQYKSVHKREPVHTMIATPAVDTLAIATERSHKVQIIHLKLDRIIMTFQHNQRIESMSFSTMSRVAYLAVASGCKLHLWDLNDRRLMHHRTSHQKNTILTCAFLPNSTTLIYSTRFSVTKLNIEILDDGAQDKHQQNTKIVELVTRGGAKEGVSSLELGQYDAGLVLYGCGESLWRRHMYTGTLTRALTRENMKSIRLGNITRILSSPATPLVFTLHESSSFVQIWSDTKNLCKTLDTKFDAAATSMCFHPDLSHLIIGSETGQLCRINIQSGNIRGYYPPLPVDKTKHRNISRAVGNFSNLSNRPNKYVNQVVPTGSPIIGMIVAPLGGFFVSVSESGYVCKWDVYSGRLVSAKIVTASGLHSCKSYNQDNITVTKVASSPNGTLLAMITSFNNIYVVDTAHMSVIRKIGGSDIGMSGFTGLLLSYDGRRLYTSNIDGSIIVYDVPTNTCIDKLNFAYPVLAMSLDPKKGLLATVDGHAGGRSGIRLWRDKSFYHSVMLNGSLKDEGQEMDTYILNENVLDVENNKEDVPIEFAPSTVDQYDNCITYSSLPSSHYKQLFHLELIKERNKPKEQIVQKPPNAPFFLQSYNQKNNNSAKLVDDKNVQDETWASAWSDDENNDISEGVKLSAPTNNTDIASLPETKRKYASISHARSNLATVLRSCNGSYGAVTDLLKGMGPSSIDVAFRTLCHGVHDKEGLELLVLSCEWLTESLESRSDFDIINAYLHRFMIIHGSILCGIEEDFTMSDGDVNSDNKRARSSSFTKSNEIEQNITFIAQIQKLKKAQKLASEQFKSKMQLSLCLLQHFSKMI